MVLTTGKKYLFVTQRYIYSGTVETVTPTHAVLGTDAEIHYDDVGDFGEWSKKHYKNGSRVPGQVVSLLGTDCTPILNIV